MRDVDELVVLNVFTQSQFVCWLDAKNDNPMLVIDLCGEGPQDVFQLMLASPLEKMEIHVEGSLIDRGLAT